MKIRITPCRGGKKIEVDHGIAINSKNLSIIEKKQVDHFFELLKKDFIAEPFTNFSSEIISESYDQGLASGFRIGFLAGAIASAILAILIMLI